MQEAVRERWTTMTRAMVTAVPPDEPQWFYPAEWVYLVPTESWPPTDEAAVQRYREHIRLGVRPAVIGLRTISTSRIAPRTTRRSAARCGC